MSVLVGNRPSPRQRKSQQPEMHKIPPSSALIRVMLRVPQTPVTAALINAQSVGNKSASICDHVATNGPSICAIVETWHDSSDCPTLVACVPPGYGCLEKARPRTGEHANSTATNHGSMCLLYLTKYSARVVSLPSCKTLEALAVYLHGSGLNLLVVILYCQGSAKIKKDFFD